MRNKYHYWHIFIFKRSIYNHQYNFEFTIILKEYEKILIEFKNILLEYENFFFIFRTLDNSLGNFFSNVLNLLQNVRNFLIVAVTRHFRKCYFLRHGVLKIFSIIWIGPHSYLDTGENIYWIDWMDGSNCRV